MAFSGPLEDRTLIRERYSAYSGASTRMDVDAWMDCWADDCKWTVPWGEIRGKDALRAQTSAIFQGLKGMAFFMDVGSIEVNGDEAKCQCHCLEIFILPDGTRNDLIGLYEDRMVRQADGQWRFIVRDYKVHIGEPPMSG